MYRSILIGALALVLSAGSAMAAGDLSRKCKKLTPLELGTDDAGYKVSQDKYELETGKCYRLLVKASGKKEYAMRGERFFRNMWIRKIEAGGMEIKAAVVDELEFEDESEAELFFTMIVPGKYTLAAKGLEEKGTVVTFDVKK